LGIAGSEEVEAATGCGGFLRSQRVLWALRVLRRLKQPKWVWNPSGKKQPYGDHLSNIDSFVF
jgi:hypothetical protein